MNNAVWNDASNSLKRLPMAFYFAWSDTKARYRRSVLGPFWLVLGTVIGVVGLGYLWGTLLQEPHHVFVPSLTVGLVVWQFVSGCLVEATLMFVNATAWIRNVRTPYLFFPVQLIIKHLINLAHHAVVVVLVLLIYPPPLSIVQVLVVPGVLLVVANLFWMSTLLGLLGARFRDLNPMVGALMPLLFFLSPVIFRPEHLGLKAHVMWFNPLTYLITLIRDPVQGVVPAWWIYGVAVGGFFVGLLVLMGLLNRTIHRIAFWV